jgi:malto-oligosyltrehalose synthase
VTAPVMAKGIEDTALYQYHRLSCLNEVGSDPQRFGASTQALHLANAERARDWPLALLATSTHDTKRSEDVRARIAVLSELPEAWQRSVIRWTRLNRSKRRQLADGPAPSRNDEYLLYQTLLGLWPDDGPEAVSRAEFVDRMQAYMLKAAREAKTHTSWLSPAADYEEALQQFVARALATRGRSAFLQDFARLAERVAYFGGLNSLAQTTLKLTCPGVPDVYQGAEDRLLTLVDPDNRQPVDFQRAAIRLEKLNDHLRQEGHAAVARRLAAQPAAGAAKLFVTHSLLTLRGSTSALGPKGRYEAIPCAGALSDHICAYARVSGDSSLLTIAVRWFARLTAGEMRPPLGSEVWQDTRLEWTTTGIGSCFEDVFTRRRLSAREVRGLWVLELGQVLTDFPLAVLERTPTG